MAVAWTTSRPPPTALSPVHLVPVPVVVWLPQPVPVTSGSTAGPDFAAQLADRLTDHYALKPAQARSFVRLAQAAGERHGVDPVMLLAISAVESRFDPKAESPAGAVGLTQTMPSAHPEKLARIHAQGKSAFDPEASLDMGAEIYAQYHRRQRGDGMRALQQYNGSLPDPTQRYAHKVMAVHRLLSGRVGRG